MALRAFVDLKNLASNWPCGLASTSKISPRIGPAGLCRPQTFSLKLAPKMGHEHYKKNKKFTLSEVHFPDQVKRGEKIDRCVYVKEDKFTMDTYPPNVHTLHSVYFVSKIFRRRLFVIGVLSKFKFQLSLRACVDLQNLASNWPCGLVSTSKMEPQIGPNGRNKYK